MKTVKSIYDLIAIDKLWVERVKVLSLWRVGDGELGKSTMIGRLEMKKKLLYTCINLRNSEIFFCGAKLAQHYNKSPENVLNEALATMNHGELEREGSNCL